MGWQDAPEVSPGGAAPASKWQSAPEVSQGSSLGKDFVRGQGLGARSVIEGASSVVTVPSDMLAGLLDAALEKAGVNFRFGSSSQALSDLLTKAGLPKPETDSERFTSSLGKAVSAVPATLATGGALAGAASPVVAGVGETLQANPVLQTVSAATGATGSEVARRAGYGPVGQAVGGVIGAAAPGAIAAGAQALTRGAFRGGEEGRQTVEQNIDTFAKAGTTPTVGQATEGRIQRAAESGLSKAPGSAGVMARAATDQAANIGDELEQQAQALVGRGEVSAEQAGRAIENGVKGSGGFIERFRGVQKGLYDKLDSLIAPDKPVAPTATQTALADLSTPIKGAAETSKKLINPTIASISEGLQADAANGTVPYEALKQLRTRVGQEIDSGLASDVPAAQWKRIYGALSEDMKTAADTPDALAAWKRADNYTSAGMKRIESLESIVNRNGGPEAVFKAATSGTKEGATTLRSVMQSLDEDGQKMVTAAVVRRLGRATAGAQNELGDKFSTESFLTNWNTLSPEAKRTLFNRYGNDFRSNMDAVSKLAANLREGSAVFRNPSGTNQATNLAATVGGMVMAALTGHPEVAGAIAGGMGVANLSARLMTNPRFVKWLAQSTKVPAGSYTAMVGQLGQQAQKTKDIDLARAAVALQQQGGDQAANDQNRR